jgi:ribulose-5-phosphate 4-epimerase/fuculose-1-phosphate aldolase
MLVRQHLAYHDYEGVALNHDERERIVADMGDKHLLMLRNHGTLAVGETCSLAFMGIYFLERACATQVRALSGKAYMPTQEAIETVDEQSETLFQPGIDALAWPALLRKLDRIDPSFRD